ncbi:FecR family protein [Pseudochryseolinea flava]|uniref:FecR family protein n=1 Tax=Pseudochryseolinea flava TaxID=2059302 RepID=A0A364Y125_9BACT|nr:FecR domain-containing protein [Pseudochryseolinea flava]RAW00523.1 hypothetical protein DQQ10_13060 [Pseudochryseolinea flava]
MQNTEPAERQWYLAAKALSSSLTSEEQMEWEAFTRNEKFRHDFEQLKKHWNVATTLPYADINKEADWEIVLGKIKAKKPTKQNFSIGKIWRVAAVITGFIALSIIAWNVGFKRNGQAIATMIQAPKGARTHVVLPDSSSVWLNAESKISFDQHFGKDNRDITLEGEAFFDVEKEAVPFQIHTADFDIEVLGTAFNVKAYHNDDVLSTTLIRGSLRISKENSSGTVDQVVLKPNEKVVLRGTPQERLAQSFALEKNIDGQAEADWKDGWLTVRGESLQDLCKKIERLYNVTVRFEDESLKSYHYTGRIQQLSLEQVLNALALTSPVMFNVNEKEVTLRLNKSTQSKYQ